MAINLEFDFLNSFYTLFQRKSPPEETREKKPESEKQETDFSRIRCPHCKWQPKKSSRWSCADCGHPEYFSGACYTEWNTFETRGLCPACRHRWRWTSCLACFGWSLHEDWYVNEKD